MEKALTKYFWVFNLVSLAVIAYLLAGGTGELIAGKLRTLLPADDASATRSRPMRPSRRLSYAEPNGLPILERNIFDSVTGPLDPNSLAKNEEPTTDAQPGGPLPIVPCPQGQVSLFGTVAGTGVQDWSFASVSEGGQNRLVRVGDQLSNRTVSGITWRYLFLRGNADECYIDMYADPNAAPPQSPAVAAAEPAAGSEGIQVISETERVVDRSLVDKLLADPTQFIRTVRVRPHKVDGKVVGFKLRRFQKDSPLAALGAQKDDVITGVNGMDLTSVDKALGAYQGLRSSNELTFSIIRGGKPMDLQIRIR